ncbi:hypothetical protein GGX14DRAFT_397174 [Mycena pura]|uniref:Hydrophobin n=1 Tax=Mycena pura TaxID=153505 RepID=A0AAD6YAV5_9AGAR|nr:hypothetical protein GGX14DRAFT_397174 [Mycena pura]
MFSKLSLLATSLLVVSCVALGPPYPPAPSGTVNMCCAFVGDNSNIIIQAIASIEGVDITALPGLFAANCVPITSATQICSNTAVNCNINQLGACGGPVSLNFLCVLI